MQDQELEWGFPLQQNPAGGIRRWIFLYRLSHLRHTQKLCHRAIPLLDLYQWPRWSNQVQSVPLCWWHHSLLSHQGSHWFHPTTGWPQNTESWERRWLVSFHVKKCHQLTVTKIRNRIPTSYTLHNQTLESHQCIVPQSRVDRNLTLGGTHPVNCCKSQQSECLCIQESEGMPDSCPDTLLQRPCASSARICICGVGPPSSTSAAHTGDGAMTLSPLHPSWLKSHLKRLCPSGSAPAENLRSRSYEVSMI